MAQIEANELDHDEEHILMSQSQEWKFNIEFGMYAFSKGKNGKKWEKKWKKKFPFWKMYMLLRWVSGAQPPILAWKKMKFEQFC